MRLGAEPKCRRASSAGYIFIVLACRRLIIYILPSTARTGTRTKRTICKKLGGIGIPYFDRSVIRCPIVGNDLVRCTLLIRDQDNSALGCAVGKIRGGVHADVDHAFLDLLVQVLDDLVSVSLVPAALHSAGVIDDTGGRSIVGFCGLIALAATETAEDDGDDNQDTEDDSRGFLELGIIVLAAALVGVFGLIHFELLLPLSA